MDFKHFKLCLLTWYNHHKRDLPFRHTKDPYKIWLAEIMLQQTTVATVIDYYNRFTRKFPDVASVAHANDSDLLHLWQGLGYYSRVRNFKKACDTIMLKLDGVVPKTYAHLLELPGIGNYTAAAISSIAYNEPVAVVDGNVKRVLARIFSYKKEISSKEANLFFLEKANSLLDKKNPGDFNQAMMELGATVCTPKSPRCPTCPVARFCCTRGSNPESLPIKKKTVFINTKYTALVLTLGDKIILKKPHAKNLIANMWEVPCLYKNEKLAALARDIFKNGSPLTKKPIKKGAVRHAITNKRITTEIFMAEFSPSHARQVNKSVYHIVSKHHLAKLTLNTISKKIIRSTLTKPRHSDFKVA